MSHRTLWGWQSQVQVSPQSRGSCCRHQRGAVGRPAVSLQKDTLQGQTLFLYPGHGWHHLLVWTRLRWGAAGPTCWATRCLDVRNPFGESFGAGETQFSCVQRNKNRACQMFLTPTFPGNFSTDKYVFQFWDRSFRLSQNQTYERWCTLNFVEVDEIKYFWNRKSFFGHFFCFFSAVLLTGSYNGAKMLDNENVIYFHLFIQYKLSKN